LPISHPGLELVTGDPLASQPPDPDPLQSVAPCSGCAAGLSGMTLLADGTITPCRRLPLPLGNIRDDSLREIWAGSAVLAALRDKSRYHGRCGRCPRWAVCRGCRAVAFAYTGDYLADDPHCFFKD